MDRHISTFCSFLKMNLGMFFFCFVLYFKMTCLKILELGLIFKIQIVIELIVTILIVVFFQNIMEKNKMVNRFKFI